MWEAHLKIIDLIQNKREDVIYKMRKIVKYKDLYYNLANILKSVGYKETKYRPTQISFTFDYLDKKILVDDWNKYVLNNDVIEIRLIEVPKIYSLADSYNGLTIISSLKIEKIYNHYNQHFKKYDWPIFVKCDDSLLDVLENPENRLNRCINRLIHRYTY